MISLTLFSTCLLLQAAPLPLPVDSGTVIRTEVVRCGECGVNLTAVAAMITDLKTDPSGLDREEAARSLRRIAWKCHHEVVVALSDSLLRDPDGCVRREAAESLTRMGACEAEAHMALQRAAASDRNLFVRAQAKRGLKSLSHRCVGDCVVCETPMPATTIVGLPTVVRRVPPTTQINVRGVHIAITPGRAFGIEFGRRRPPVPDVVMIPRNDPGPRELAPIPEEVPPFSPRMTTPQPPQPGSTTPVPSQPIERRSSQKPSAPVSEKPIRRPTLPATDLPPLIGPSQGTPG